MKLKLNDVHSAAQFSSRKFMRNSFFASVSAFSLILGAGFCSGEPSESEMKLAFSRFLQSDPAVSKLKMNELEKEACKASPSKSSYLCDFFDSSLNARMLLPNIHVNLKNSELQFAVEQG